MLQRLSLLVCACLATAAAHGVVIWDESIQGDLSGDRFNPNSFNLGAGTHSIIGSTGNHDRDYFHFSIAPGHALTAITLTNYVSLDDISFLGVQAGTIFTEDPQAANVANLLGWTFFGTPEIGVDLLPLMGANWGSMGFTPPLTGSDYTFWLQQTGDPTDYALDFTIEAVPEPSTLAAAGVFLVGLARRRRR